MQRPPPATHILAVVLVVVPPPEVCVVVVWRSVELVGVLVVVVAGAGHVAPPHASQQLSTLPTQAVPPFGLLQAAACFFTLHFCTPLAVVRQQVTEPARPQVECTAQRMTAPLQAPGSAPAFTASFMTCAAHFT